MSKVPDLITRWQLKINQTEKHAVGRGMVTSLEQILSGISASLAGGGFDNSTTGLKKQLTLFREIEWYNDVPFEIAEKRMRHTVKVRCVKWRHGGATLPCDLFLNGITKFC